ncbi:MAG: hypothetical protein M1829_000524 [Trizodia sp. TS-e1964]|nr:MAG: hypothetical protein M1829_000524 [Trizodia sp. TS-e1964]
MNINKKLDRMKQWAGERMGGEVKTGVSDDFKMLETEMTLRHEGMERLQKSMTLYVKSLSKRNEVEDKEKTLPISYLGSTMISHGEDFEHDSEFGSCLIGMGRAQERIGRAQEMFAANATTTWLESLERSLAQMKEYQSARKKLETRRLAYDASLSKMQKVKREDFRVEEELRSQKAKYEESSEDVYRRMQDIKEAEAESIHDIGAFLDCELEYYERCREMLLQLKKEWPVGQSSNHDTRDNRRHARSRSNTAHSYTERYNIVEEPKAPSPEPRPSIRSNRIASGPVHDHSRRELPAFDHATNRPAPGRISTFEGPMQLQRELSAMSAPRISRVSTEPASSMPANRVHLRPVARVNTNYTNSFGEHSDEPVYVSPDRSHSERSTSPANSHGSGPSRSASSTTLNHAALSNGKKAPPPPPPSRSKKPPPPLPMKRSALSTATSNGSY